VSVRNCGLLPGALDARHRGNISFADDQSSQRHSQLPAIVNETTRSRSARPTLFHHQLKANPKICHRWCVLTTPPRRQDSRNHQWRSKSVRTVWCKRQFGFVAQSKQPNASLSYHDDGASGGSIDVHSVIQRAHGQFRGQLRQFKGDAKVHQQWAILIP